MRIAMGVEFDGSNFFGWQTQVQEPTVQSSLETALARVANEPIVVHGSGRTDTGVHARGQVFHFDTHAVRTPRSWILGANTNLRRDISILWCLEVEEEFHSRFSASARCYRYRILNRWIRPAIDRDRVCWIRNNLDPAVMHEAAQALVGEHDFTSYRAMKCGASHALRRIHQIEVRRVAEEIIIDIEGNAFLHHMVRNIVGVLLEIGKGERPVEWAQTVLLARDRECAGMTAAPTGLSLQRVRYPARFNIPQGSLS